MKISRDTIQKDIHKFVIWLYKFLRFFFILSLLAISFSWVGLLNIFYFVDLFSHFTLQYAIGGLALGIIFLCLKDYRTALICFCIFALSFIESRWYLHHPLQFMPQNEKPVYRLMVYNHNIGRRNFTSIREWLAENHQSFDVIVLQEANQGTSDMAEGMRDLFPHQVHEPRENPFGMVVLSRYPFIEERKIPLYGPYFESFALHFSIESKNASKPLAVYAVHAYPPAGVLASAQRDFDVLETAREASYNQASNIVMLGDVNLTPFAPAFGQAIQISNLNYQSYGVFLNSSWPSFNWYGFLRIPIDHAFYSDGLIQVEKTIGPSFGSDHQSLIVGYAENK